MAELALVVLAIPRGFSGELGPQVGVSHIVEHLVAIGGDSGPKFNGFTTDSLTVVHAICHEREVDAVAGLLSARLDGFGISAELVEQEISNIDLETFEKRPTEAPYAGALGQLGFSDWPGDSQERPSVETVLASLPIFASEAFIAVFSPLQYSEPRLVRKPGTPAGDARSSHRESLPAEVVVGHGIFRRITTAALRETQKLELATDVSLVDTYLKKFGGFARIGFSDHYSFWTHDTWLGYNVPLRVRARLKDLGVHSLAELAMLIRRDNPRALDSARSLLMHGPDWLNVPVVRAAIAVSIQLASQHLHAGSNAPSHFPLVNATPERFSR